MMQNLTKQLTNAGKRRKGKKGMGMGNLAGLFGGGKMGF